ncbi:GAF domain-containing protein [Nocardioides exalbidus]|uniref:GAF domain-containing protein n=1 Tax=Nocardioides exalbidus TaxID=402596 RepID=A0A1H4R285_9ACTN|nr:GAF and ANTAR domain-containing protein [Nocardioides exalbidus]SEC25926.1 GAF domain-containing protein [Nocardioides exalbidus]
MDTEVFARQLGAAVRDLNAQPDPPHTLQRMVELTPEFFDSCDYVGVSLVEHDRIRTPVASTEELRRLDESQYALGQGPCFDAIRREETVIVDDLAIDDRWPDWGRAMVAGLAVRASISFRLFTRDNTWGALNVYSEQPGAFAQDDVLHGQVIAAMCAVALARSINDDQLASALETRTVIGQATGIVMERYGLDPETAFNVMRRLSSEHSRKLRDLAAQVVAERRLPGSADGVGGS